MDSFIRTLLTVLLLILFMGCFPARGPGGVACRLGELRPTATHLGAKPNKPRLTPAAQAERRTGVIKLHAGVGRAAGSLKLLLVGKAGPRTTPPPGGLSRNRWRPPNRPRHCRRSKTERSIRRSRRRRARLAGQDGATALRRQQRFAL
jgi:hypothetical protein